jgi:ABC-type transport system involved in multi-copper enzyme maturation permease subunit
MQANPVIVKELRGRMRGARATVTLTIYLVVLAGVTLLFYWMLRPSASYGPAYGGPDAANIGKFLFSALVVFQTILVCLLTPAFTAGSITAEREQKTYDLLMTTLLPARSIIFGKLGSAMAFVVLLILAIAPLESLSFMFGGVSPEEILLSQVVMLAAALLFSSVGIFWSSLLRSSVASNVLTYGTILFLLVGIPLLWLVVTTATNVYYDPTGGTPIAQTEPFIYISGTTLSINPLIAMVFSDIFYSMGKPLFIYTDTTLINGKSLLVISPWLVFCLEALLMSAILVLLSIRNVQPVRYGKSPQTPVQVGEGIPAATPYGQPYSQQYGYGQPHAQPAASAVSEVPPPPSQPQEPTRS